MGRICKETGGTRAGCTNADGEYGVVDGGCAGCEQLHDDEDAASLRAEVERLKKEAAAARRTALEEAARIVEGRCKRMCFAADEVASAIRAAAKEAKP